MFSIARDELMPARLAGLTGDILTCSRENSQDEPAMSSTAAMAAGHDSSTVHKFRIG
jgi:hypothetical protein